jgi:hypothetical protein
LAFNVVSSIAVVADDCHSEVGETGHYDEEYLRCKPYETGVADDLDIYLRFQVPDIVRGAKIISATLTLKAYNDFAGEYGHSLYIEGAANASAFSDAEILSARLYYIALGGLFDPAFQVASWSAGDVLTTYSFASMLQQLLADNAWVANNYISIKISQNGLWPKDEPESDFYAKEYDIAHSTSYRVVLTITYINRTYSKGDYASLPANTTDLENLLSSAEYVAVEADDGSYASQVAANSGQPFGIFLFKDQDVVGQSGAFTLSWNGQTPVAGSESAIFLQVYNYNSAAWETIASNNVIAANTDFTLSGSITSNTAYYFSSGYIAARVYQEAKV